MKIKVLWMVAVVCMVSTVGNAQKYESCFGEESTTWVIVKPTSFWGLENSYSPYYYTFDSIDYYGWYNETTKEGSLLFHKNDNAELWRWEPKIDKFNLLMNLDWQVGDTVFIDQKELELLPNVMPYTIVDSIYKDEQNRKIIHTELVLEIDTIQFNLEFIEGVGPNASMFLLETHGFFWRSSCLLLCVHKDNLKTYSNTKVGNDCTYPKPVGVEISKRANDLDFSFDNEFISIEAPETFSGEMCLVNAHGKLVLKEKIDSQSLTFNIRTLPRGVYLVQITDHTKPKVRTGKISIN